MSSYCSTHRREITQDHLRHYDDLVAKYGLRCLFDMCVCQSIYTFKSKPIMAQIEEDFRRYKRHDDMMVDLQLEKKRKEEEMLEKAGRWYFITFTRPDTEKDPMGVLKSTKRLLKSKQVSPLQWCYSLELTEKGTPHTHIRLFSNKYFDYKKVGNFNDGYRYDVQPERTSCSRYIIKEESKPSAEYLSSYGLDSFVWQSDNYEQPVSRNIVEYN